MKNLPRILVVRDDRLGDTLLSLPALEALRLAFPDWGIDLVCRAAVAPALAPYLRDREIGSWPAERGGPPGEYAAALYLHAAPELLYAGWRAGIPLRVGARSKLAAFLFLNDSVVQHRSRADRSEAEYNLDLARRLCELLATPLPEGPVRVEIPEGEAETEAARKWLGERGLEPRGFLVVHPGMGGSALNLPARRYIELIDALGGHYGVPVVLSTGPAAGDRAMADALRAERPRLVELSGLGLGELREVFRQAAHVVAPSTGPLHLAHFVGTPTLGLFSPVRSHRARRWAPWGGTGQSRVLFPEVTCPATRACLGERCREYPCMERAPWVRWLAGLVGPKSPVEG